MTGAPTIRRELRAGDLGRIVAHHGTVYEGEYGVDRTFEAQVAATVAAAGKRGFPREREGIWIVELDGRHAGSVALTDEGDGLATLRWVVLDPDLRGHGLGRAPDLRGRGERRVAWLRDDRPGDLQRAASRRPHLP